MLCLTTSLQVIITDLSVGYSKEKLNKIKNERFHSSQIL